MSRPGWVEYWFQVADLVATRATCPRRAVGAVAVRGDRLIATGYNGAPAGEPHCTDVGCDLYVGTDGLEHCGRVLHAEENLVCTAARFGISLEGADVYVNFPVCGPCSRRLTQAGVEKVWDIR